MTSRINSCKELVIIGRTEMEWQWEGKGRPRWGFKVREILASLDADGIT